MALKDWDLKTRGRILTQFQNRKNNLILDIIPAKNLGNNRYYVTFAENDGIRRTTTPHTKVLANKSQALKYARAYMRKH